MEQNYNLIPNRNHRQLNLKIDNYTKAVLTIIAISLLIIAGNMILKPQTASASDPVQDVNIKYINGYTVSGTEIPVNLKQINGSTADEIPVNVQSIRGHNIWNDQLPVDIKAINGNPIFGGEMPVKAH